MISAQPRAAVIPVGSLEQHGPHLPVSTDSEIATEISRLLCKRGGFLLLPTIQYGVSFEHAPFFNLSVGSRTMAKMVGDIVASLHSNGISTVFVINGHHGNRESLGRLGEPPAGARVSILDYWRFMKGDFDHAGLVETSIMLAISKNVRMSKAVKGFVPAALTKSEKVKLARRASKSFISVTGNGIWGDPRGATASRGRKLIAEIVANLDTACQVFLTKGSKPLYQ